MKPAPISCPARRARSRWIAVLCGALVAACGPGTAISEPQDPAPADLSLPSDRLHPSSAAMAVEGSNQTAGVGPTTQDPAMDQTVIAGERLYTRYCSACHSLDHNRVGPRHRGVYGRPAGLVADFAYSAALDQLDLVWDADTLDSWLENPSALVPGTSMGFRVRKPDDRAAIIAYLASVSDE